MEHTLSKFIAPSNLANAPVFLVGSVRSGTTMLRLMLESHPEIAFLFESEFIVDQVAPDGSYPSLAEFHEFLRANRIFRLSGLEVDPSLEFEQLVNSFLDQHKERCGKRLVGATVHHNFDRLRYIWPNARFIHLYRDGRAVARSVINMGWAANMWHGSIRWEEAENTWNALQPKLQSKDWIDVRYEELVVNFESELKRICDFIGVDYSEDMLSYHENSTYGLPDAAIIDKWRTKLTAKQIALAESRIETLLRDRGYETLSNPVPAAPGELKRAWLELQDRWGRARFRVRRYGLGVTAGIFFARRLRLKKTLATQLRRMDDIEDMRLH